MFVSQDSVISRTFTDVFDEVAVGMFLTYLLLCYWFVNVEGYLLDGSGSAVSGSTNLTSDSTVNCTDNPRVDCEVVDTYTQICTDIHHAKTICRRYCKLCDLVDGNWSDWTSWSACDVTCGPGNITRVRTCTNPAPANRGLNCSGHGEEFHACLMDPCPVRGGWSAWGSWATCSVTCGVGNQRRDRTCSNPAPLYYGDHCFGDSHEDRICFSHHCADGGWSTWRSWGSCSKTCGIGIRTRERYCNNPSPSLLGDYCQGPSIQSDTCGSIPSPNYQELHKDGSCCAKFTNSVFMLCDGGGPGICNSHKGQTKFNMKVPFIGDKFVCVIPNAADYCKEIGYCSGTSARNGSACVYISCG